MDKRDPFILLEKARARADADDRLAYDWVLAIAILSHVRWYLTHGVPAAAASIIPDDDSIGDRLAEAGPEVAPWIN